MFQLTSMGTSACIFFVFAARTVREIQGKLIAYGLFAFLGTDLEHHGEFLTVWYDLVGNKFVAILGEGELGWVRAVAHGDGNDLSGRRDYLARDIQESNLDFLVCVDQEFSVWYNRVDDTAAIGGFDFFRRIGEGESGDECGECNDVGFHSVVWFMLYGDQ